MTNTSQNTNKIGDLTDAVTWGVLLSKWTAFAQSAIALPKDAEGDRWKASVAPMIGLQAICYALGEAASVALEERLLGTDRSAVVIRTHARELDQAWFGHPMPEEILELISDAHAALACAEHLGFHARVSAGGFVMPDIDALCRDALDRGYSGELFAASPGTILAAGEPAVFSKPGPIPFDVPGLSAEGSPTIQEQVFRSVDEQAGKVIDEVVRFHERLPAGRPLFERLISDGHRVAEAWSEDRVRRWIEQQAQAFDGRAHEVLRATGGGGGGGG